MVGIFHLFNENCDKNDKCEMILNKEIHICVQLNVYFHSRKKNHTFPLFQALIVIFSTLQMSKFWIKMTFSG